MKLFAVFAAVVAVAFASPAEWTIHELSTAIQNPTTPAALVPVLEEALNELMMQSFLGSSQSTITVSTVVQDFSSWTLHELSEAIQDSATDPHLVIYLEHALNSMMADIMAGNQPESVIVATPVGLLPVEATIVPSPVDTVVVPAPVESVVAPSSPLVQIIVNVKSQQESALVPAPVEEIAVNPVDVIAVNPINPSPIIPSPVVLPEPVLPEVVPQPVVLPQPVLPGVIAPSPVVLPQPVLPEVIAPSPVVLPQPVLPGVIIPSPVVLPEPSLPEVEVSPVVPAPVVLPQPVAPVVEVPVNPIDVIAVTAPEVNPIDILAPLPPITPVNAGDIVGPIV